MVEDLVFMRFNSFGGSLWFGGWDRSSEGLTCGVTRNAPKWIGAVALFSADISSVELVDAVIERGVWGSEVWRSRVRCQCDVDVGAPIRRLSEIRQIGLFTTSFAGLHAECVRRMGIIDIDHEKYPELYYKIVSSITRVTHRAFNRT